MSHKIIFDDGLQIPINNHNEKDYVVDLRPKVIHQENKKKLKSYIVNEIMNTDWKKIKHEDKPKVVSTIIQYFTGYDPDSEENLNMTSQVIATYTWLFK
jgi:hypothetical protein